MLEILEGTFISNRKGYGFIEFANSTRRLFVPAKFRGSAIHGDYVKVELVEDNYSPSKGEKEVARIKSVIKHNIREIVGTLKINESDKGEFGFVVPDDANINVDVYIPYSELDGYEDNEKVLCEIRRYPSTADRKPEGVIIKSFGHKGDKFVELNAVIERFHLRDEFPDAVINEAARVANEDITEEIKKREDFRNDIVFTIDGADAKDLDDAISITKNADGSYQLGVHIADVTHYVKDKSKLDREALKRATSCYLVDKVIPMLPKELSNGSCSLHPNTNKLTLSVIMNINKKGKVVNHRIVEGVINTAARLTYTEVWDMLNNDQETIAKRENVYPSIMIAKELAEILVRRRTKLGAIDFEFDEDKITLDDECNVVSVEPYPKNFSNKIIEEFMLITNETVAEEFFWMESPFVYRVHEDPSSEKMDNFSKVLAGFGYAIKGGIEDLHPKALQQLLKKVKGTPEETLISTMMLRSLKQAKYMPHCEGHFGLAIKYYSHFTSPIRRYPDLQIHRIIKDHINGRLNEKRINYYKGIINEVSQQSSLMERTAEKAEEAVHAYYRARFVERFEDKVWDASIFNISGQYVTVLINGIIKAKVEIDKLLGGIYVFNPINYQLLEQGGEKSYRIGDSMKVKLDKIDEFIYDIYCIEVEE